MSDQFTAWAIRVKGSNRYLCTHWRQDRSYTVDLPVAGFPRLFKTKRSAHNALTAWTRGAWARIRWSKTQKGFIVDQLPSPDPRPGRSRDEMEVVEVQLSIADPCQCVDPDPEPLKVAELSDERADYIERQEPGYREGA